MFGRTKPVTSRPLSGGWRRERAPLAVPPALVVTAGMRQSGSTLLYNILRLAYEAKGIDHDCGFVLRFDAMDKTRRLLVKSHEFDPRVHGDGAYVITLMRDVRDTVASRFRRFERTGKIVERKDGGDAERVAREQVALHAAFARRADFELVYEDYKRDPEQAIGALFADLFGDVDEGLVRAAIAAAEALQNSDAVPKKSRHGDKKSDFDRHLLSKSHVTNGGAIGGYAETLRPDEIVAIERACGRWLRANGYKVGRR